jgi:hypothetical protein
MHGKVERIETHASVVILAGPRAYKIKRANIRSSTSRPWSEGGAGTRKKAVQTVSYA